MYEIQYSRGGGCYVVGDISGGSFEPLSDHDNRNDAQEAMEQLQNPIVWRHIRDLSNQVRDLQNQVADQQSTIEALEATLERAERAAIYR